MLFSTLRGLGTARISRIQVVSIQPQLHSELEAKLKDHVRHVLGSIAVPAEIAFPDQLPKTGSGKIMRRLHSDGRFE
jgi:acyl-coenzyme A synthetase/AMP-(fatty) acid ligase